MHRGRSRGINVFSNDFWSWLNQVDTSFPSLVSSWRGAPLEEGKTLSLPRGRHNGWRQSWLLNECIIVNQHHLSESWTGTLCTMRVGIEARETNIMHRVNETRRHLCVEMTSSQALTCFGVQDQNDRYLSEMIGTQYRCLLYRGDLRVSSMYVLPEFPRACSIQGTEYKGLMRIILCTEGPFQNFCWYWCIFQRSSLDRKVPHMPLYEILLWLRYLSSDCQVSAQPEAMISYMAALYKCNDVGSLGLRSMGSVSSSAGRGGKSVSKSMTRHPLSCNERGISEQSERSNSASDRPISFLWYRTQILCTDSWLQIGALFVSFEDVEFYQFPRQPSCPVLRCCDRGLQHINRRQGIVQCWNEIARLCWRLHVCFQHCECCDTTWLGVYARLGCLGERWTHCRK